MKKYDLISSLVWICVGLVFCKGAISFGLGDLSEPGPGFFPFWMSVSLITFSFVHFFSSLRKGETSHLPVGLRFWPEGEYVTRIVVIIFLLFMFVIALDYLGFVLTTFLFMFFLLKLIESRKLRTLFLISGLTTVLSYAIFELWLKANLPKGFLGF